MDTWIDVLTDRWEEPTGSCIASECFHTRPTRVRREDIGSGRVVPVPIWCLRWVQAKARLHCKAYHRTDIHWPSGFVPWALYGRARG